MDDYGEMKPLWKDEHGITDPADGGILAIKLIKGKELMKADLIGKSDPYAVIKHGSQKYTTKVIFIPIWLRNRLISAGLELVTVMLKKTCIASYYKKYSVNVKIKSYN